MHKDPPPTLLERPVRDIVLHGLLTGFVASLVVFGAWSLLSANKSDQSIYQLPSPPPRVK